MPASNAPAPAQRRPFRANRPGFDRSGDRRPNGPKPEPKTLFQSYFKSVSPRTYAAQVKEAGNGNHFIVLTEGKRDDKTDEVRKTRLFIFSEDFDAFRDLLRDTFAFVRDHPVPAEVKAKRAKFWAKDREKKPQMNTPERK
jgi:Protein of unknown function (DUF3276)